jgi:PadR family transcriptional regulator PadR
VPRVEWLGIDVADRAKSDLLQGTLDLLLLHVVSLGALHGYAIGQRLQQITRDALQVQQGSLYPALHRLEERRWLRAEWKPSETGRDAKFYSLTRSGRTRLVAERVNWQRLAQAIALVLRTVE